MSDVIRHLRRALLPRHGAGLTDGQLLESFLSRRDEAALAALVQRHGPMVWGVCRRVLPNYHDAEDAFQATFLVLVRKAASIVPSEKVVPWLHGVAHQTARKARATAARRKARERQVLDMPELETEPQDQLQDLQHLLDQELSHLPDRYRGVLLLCDLEGKTRKEAAHQLGVPEGTVAGRLARARVLLAKRLARHGLAVSGGAVAVALSHSAASASVPAPLLRSTIQAATLVAANHPAAEVVSASVAALTEGVLKTIFLSRVKLATAVVLVVGLLGIAWGMGSTRAATPPAREQEVVQASAPVLGRSAKEVGKPAKDAQGKTKIRLPKGPPPIQILVSLAKDGKLVVRSSGPSGLGPPPSLSLGVPSPAPDAGGETMRSHTYDLGDVQVLDTSGKKVDKKELLKLLKDETVALRSFGGHPIDPLHLRVLKEGTLIFILPGPKGGGFLPLPDQAIPLPAPEAPPVPL
jgi:RNA polymerase sigma factor (sigma-70 family)